MFSRVKLIPFDCLYHKPFSIVLCLGNFLQYILIIPPHLIPQIQIHSHFPTTQPHFLCYLITKSTLYCPNIFLSKGAVHWSVVGLLGAKPLKKLSLPWSCHLSIVPQLGSRAHRLCCCEFISVMALLCPEDTVMLQCCWPPSLAFCSLLSG